MNADDKSRSDLSEAELAALDASVPPGLVRLFAWASEHRAEAEALFAATRSLGRSKAIQYVKDHPPSPECVLFLAYVGHRALLAEQTRAGATAANARKVRAREYAQAEWPKYAAEWGRNKARFARKVKPDLRAMFGVETGVKVIAETWLKDL